MKKIFLLLALGLFFVLPVLAKAERVESFAATVRINADASLDVSENIVYDFGDLPKHGIYRSILAKYQARGGNYNLRISDIAVSDERGEPCDFAASREGKYLKIKIGGADELVTGVRTYVVNYQVRRAISYFNDHDELYWNVNGNEWDVSTGVVVAKVFLPQDIDAAQARKACFWGIYGSQETCYAGISLDQGKVKDFVFNSNLDKPLLPGQGITIVVGFPKGIVRPPAFWENLWEICQDNKILILPLFCFLVMFSLWLSRGRDPKGQGAIVAQYDAPDNLSPAQAGTIIDETVNSRDVTAEIINLAVKGFLRIKREEIKNFWRTGQEYTLIKLKESDDSLVDFQSRLLESFFKRGTRIRLDSLKNEFYQDFNLAKKEIYQSLAKKYFAQNPQTVRMRYLVIAFLLGALGFFFGSALGIFSLIFSAIIIAVFGLIMPAKTKAGVLAKEHILGLKLYLTVAEKDRLNFHNAPAKNPETFEKLLPFAMVLKVEREWAKQFEDIYRQPPSWYDDSSGRAFTAFYLVNSLNSFRSQAYTAMSAKSSSASSGASGFGGGGFSGGGFGGGGGGSW